MGTEKSSTTSKTQTKAVTSDLTGDISPDIAQGEASGEPASNATATMDLNTEHELAVIAENQKRLDEATAETEKQAKADSKAKAGDDKAPDVSSKS